MVILPEAAAARTVVIAWRAVLGMPFAHARKKGPAAVVMSGGDGEVAHQPQVKIRRGSELE